MPDAKIGPYQVSLGNGEQAQCDAKLPGEQCVSWNEQPRLIAAAAQ